MSDLQPSVAFQAPEPSHLAELFPGYDIECLIATGGMGAVYRAIQRSLERTVAIKILPREFSADASFCAAFEAEAKAMARLNHPNLIGVYDFGEVDGMLFIIMEFVAGKSLFHSANGIAIDPPDVVRLVSAICQGLAHAHDNGILHRDIKPANILLDLQAQPKIGDFGLARPVERKIEEGEEIFGTPHYTAPEVVENPYAVDHHADIFSVGVVLHELLTGSLPADDPRPASMIVKCDPRFDAIVRRATNPSPAARYHSAADIAKDLQMIGKPAVPGVPRPGVGGAPVPRRKTVNITVRNKSSGTGGILFLLALGAAAGGYFYLSKNPIRIESGPGAGSVSPAPVEPAPAPTAKDDKGPSALDLSTGKPRPAIKSSGTTPKSDTPFGSTSIPDADADAYAETPSITRVAPKADVPAFFERARGIMKDRAKPLLASQATALESNRTAFERELSALIRKLGPNYRDSTEAALEKSAKAWQANGNRIPATLDDDLSLVLDTEATHAEYLSKQKTIDGTLEDALGKLSATYVSGLEKQKERYETDQDVGAAGLLEDEINRTKEDSGHFVKLMMDSK